MQGEAPAEQVCRYGVARTFQRNDLFRDLSALENVRLVAQNLRAALALADRHHVLSKGEICFTGSAAEADASEFVRKTYLAV